MHLVRTLHMMYQASPLAILTRMPLLYHVLALAIATIGCNGDPSPLPRRTVDSPPSSRSGTA